MASSKPIPTASYLSNLFKSARLTYRAIEDNPTDTKLMHTIRNDPSNMSLSSLGLLKPNTLTKTEDIMKVFIKCQLAVWICLPRTPSPSDDEKTGDEPGKKKNEFEIEKDWVSDMKHLTPIGYLVLGSEGPATHSYTVGITLFDQYQEKGYGSEAINWALDWAFMHGAAHAVRIGTVEFNVRAQHVYERLGFKKDGMLREVMFYERKWWGLIEYSMLEREWDDLRHRREIPAEEIRM